LSVTGVQTCARPILRTSRLITGIGPSTTALFASVDSEGHPSKKARETLLRLKRERVTGQQPRNLFEGV